MKNKNIFQITKKNNLTLNTIVLIKLGRVWEISGMVVERGSWGVRVATWGLRVTVAWKQTAVRRKRRLLNSGARHYLKKYSQFY